MTDSTDLAVREEAEAAIAAAQAGEFDAADVQTPILKIGQQLTREVEEGDAEAGEFINTLTNEGIGKEIGFVIAYYNKGRSMAIRKTNRYYVGPHDIIPAHWAEALGETFVGTRFDEHPDSEERFKEAVNNKTREWGSGPPISTTHIYTGLAVVSAVEGADEEFELSPVRLSLQRTNMDAVRKINSMVQMKMRNKPIWDRLFEFSTTRKQFGGGASYLLVPKLGRVTNEEERELAMGLAQAVISGRVVDNAVKAEGDEATAEPDAKGGLAVG